MQMSWRTVLTEGRVPNAPERTRQDWFLAGAFMVATLVEVIFRPDLEWPVPALVLGWTLALLLPWRRTKPLVAVALPFALIMALDVAMIASGRGTSDLWSSVVALVLIFALFRWGSGREIATSIPFVVGAHVLATIADYQGLSDVIGGFVILAITAESGLLVRSFVASQSQHVTEAKLRERQILARELHDTVAHHVSAIAIQAQAGQFLVSQESLEGAAGALATIEEEAARALDEMRSMIVTLRDESADANVDMAPQRGVFAIEGLAANPTPETPRIRVTLTGDLDTLTPSVGAASYRLAQESITNAIRHSRNASCVEVCVTGEPDQVRVMVTDDGDLVRPEKGSGGFGLVGMVERAELLGGTVAAGPGPTGGWIVDAVLPRRVSP